MRTSIFLSLALLLSTEAFGADLQTTETTLACRDDTFDYKAFRVEQTASRYYVSLGGTNLIPFGSQFWLESILGTVSANYCELILSFSSDQCTWSSTNQSLTCAAGDLLAPERNATVYCQRLIDDLGELRRIISLFPVQRLDLSASPQGFILKKSGGLSESGDVLEEQLVFPSAFDAVPALECGNAAEELAPHAPQALIRYLEASR